VNNVPVSVTTGKTVSKIASKVTSKDLVKVAFDAALEKKATDIMALDMAELLVVTDYFVLTTGSTDRQVAAIADEIESELLKQCEAKPAHREGVQEAKWILLDYVDIVVHIFQPDFRDEYRLEDLWSQAKKLRAGGVEGSTSESSNIESASSEDTVPEDDKG